MSIKIMSKVWDIEGIDSSECLVLIALADHADDQGRCYPSIARLSKRTKLSDRGVQKVISRLIEKGFITVTPCAGQGGANLYTVTATPEPRSPLDDVHPRTEFTAPPNHVRETPEPRSPKPSRTIIEPLPEANASGRDASPAEPVEDFSKQLFDRAVAFLGRHGVPERQARGIVGKWRRDHTDAAIFDAFAACSRAGAIDPIPWITARLGAAERASASVIPLDRVAAAALANLQAEAERKATSR